MKSLFFLALLLAGMTFANDTTEIAQNNPTPVKKVLPQDEIEEEISQEEAEEAEEN